MKKKLTRMLAVVLIAMMLIPTLATFVVSADEVAINIDDIENVYAVRKLDASPNESKKDDEPTYEEGMLATEPFEVTKDQYIYVGPCPDPRIEANWKKLEFIAYWYKSTGAYTAQKQDPDSETAQGSACN